MKVIGAAIQEVMESYEVEIAGKVHPVKAIRTITGHDILRYHIHGGKQVPFIKNNSRQKMEEGEVFAIETFGTTGSAYLDDDVRTFPALNFSFQFVVCLTGSVGGSIWLRQERKCIRCQLTSCIRKTST
jgi:methionine aminopeptidase